LLHFKQFDLLNHLPLELLPETIGWFILRFLLYSIEFGP
jgi:hypothetical protein